MMLKRWDDLPAQMRTPAVRPYYDALAKKRGSLIAKRIFDIGAALVLLILLSQSNPKRRQYVFNEEPADVHRNITRFFHF